MPTQAWAVPSRARQIGFGEDAELAYPLHPPNVDASQAVRRAERQYLGGRIGKPARIAARRDRRAGQPAAAAANPETRIAGD